MANKLVYIGCLCFIFLGWRCKKESDNPFENAKNDGVGNNDTIIIPADNFAYLHERIFKPTCANSGCHDGSFEPDFRTVSSSYNTLVNQQCIINDANNSYEFRVKPGAPENSLIIARLTSFIPNSSGVMPLEVDPDSDWKEKKEEYIQNIKDWIKKGAPNISK